MKEELEKAKMKLETEKKPYSIEDKIELIHKLEQEITTLKSEIEMERNSGSCIVRTD